MKVQRCKGTRDLSPREMARFRLIETAFRDCCLKWGYEEVRTPTLEYLHLFTSTGTLTPGMLGKVYSFLDWDGWSGERVVLRPDGTIPVARFYIDAMEEKRQAKLFYVTNVFIFEETGKQTRERWQCGAELIGTGSTIADVELMTLALEVLSRLGIKGVKVRLSHAGLIRALLKKLGLSAGEQIRIFDRILDGDMKTLADIKSRRGKLGSDFATLLDLEGKSSGLLKKVKSRVIQDLPELEGALDDFINIVDLVEALGYDYQIDIASGVGFEYYTGVIFQLFMGEEKIGGGGRYDALIPVLGGRDIPASGFALYLDRLMNLVQPEALTGRVAQRILVRTEPLVVTEGFSIARSLHEAGYVAELDLGAQELTDLRWTLDVRRQAPTFVLTDQVKQRKFERQTTSEILTILDEESASKDSPA